ncbi:MAG: DUF4190 domain-containing protein [Lachnospiraceae bacterium]|nr:DUF4190 domain-containing protein [Lachnospiraceae bacterium]
MSEENSVVYCSQCGSVNPDTFKFCSNCGAKLEQAQDESSSFEKEEQPVFSGGEPVTPVYEKVEAEVVSEGKVPVQEEININYGAEEGAYSSGDFNTQTPRYYSAPDSSNTGMSQTNGNIGFAIASMVCGILSIVCCCLSTFSLVLGIAAVVLGIISLNGKYDGKGMAVAGIITGGIGIAIWIIFIIIGGAGLFTGMVDELYNF